MAEANPNHDYYNIGGGNENVVYNEIDREYADIQVDQRQEGTTNVYNEIGPERKDVTPGTVQQYEALNIQQTETTSRRSCPKWMKTVLIIIASVVIAVSITVPTVILLTKGRIMVCI